MGDWESGEAVTDIATKAVLARRNQRHRSVGGRADGQGTGDGGHVRVGVLTVVKGAPELKRDVPVAHAVDTFLRATLPETCADSVEPIDDVQKKTPQKNKSTMVTTTHARTRGRGRCWGVGGAGALVALVAAIGSAW